MDDVDFWESRYRANRTPWDFGGIPSALRGYLSRFAEPGRVLLPGCGSGWEIRGFEELGWEVTAIDLAPSAVERSRALSQLASTRIHLGDFFRHELGSQSFTLIYERTFLCSLPPKLWPDYLARMADLLAPEGALAGYFLYGHDDEPPPFPISQPATSAFLHERFHLSEDCLSPDALPLFLGGERWQVWKPRRG